MTFFGMLSVLLICMTCAFIALLVLACLPRSPVRDLLVQVVGWLMAGSCGVYCLSVVDVAPEIILGPLGLFDDLIALILGTVSAVAAWKAGRARKAAARQRGMGDTEACATPKPLGKAIAITSRPARLRAPRKA